MTAPRPAKTSPNVVRQTRGGSSRRGFYVVLLLIAVVGAAAIAAVLQRSSAAAAAPVVVPPPTAAAGIRPVGYTLGNATAPVEIIEFADFECPVCGQFATVSEPDVRKQLINTGLARYRMYDLQVNTAHRNSPAASLAAACADEQGKFWPMHDRLFEGQNDWNSEATSEPRPVFAGYAQQLGLDMTRWNQCFDAHRHLERLAANRAEAERVGFQGTPNFVIGNRLYANPLTFDQIKAAVDSARTRAGATPPVAVR
ncbi:MAG TPA: thioredoxin domain-containing protein [Gemmatirosa sp.]